jgi:hypothetical protein
VVDVVDKVTMGQAFLRSASLLSSALSHKTFMFLSHSSTNVSHDLGNLIKTQSHFKATVIPWWRMAYKAQKPFAFDFEKFGSFGQLTWTKLSLHIYA